MSAWGIPSAWLVQPYPPPAAVPAFSLRLGQGSALTAHCAVIHSRTQLAALVPSSLGRVAAKLTGRADKVWQLVNFLTLRSRNQLPQANQLLSLNSAFSFISKNLSPLMQGERGSKYVQQYWEQSTTAHCTLPTAHCFFSSFPEPASWWSRRRQRRVRSTGWRRGR